MRELFSFAIYVNASSDRLRVDSRGSNPSVPFTEGKRWVTGHSLFVKANAGDKDMPLIFAQYAPLTFWAVARDIKLSSDSTTYRFTDLQKIFGRHQRSDLILMNTNKHLTNDFIRSYALVRTPPFLRNRARSRG
jgi:hypothetical protein